ncbi:MAG: multiheme c-type cytochrome, partial [bacterium]|nr:multiheme c-type cytochrome [bacterium]
MLLYIVYQWRHWRDNRDGAWTHVRLTGYLSLAVMLLCCVSGLVLTWQSLFGRRISYDWDLLHLISTVAIIAALLPHVVVLWLRARRSGQAEASRRRWLGGSLVITGAGAALIAVLSLIYQPTALVNALPPDYDMSYGADRPFAPSLAKTASGGAYDARSMAGSQSCGTSGCHEQITAEWQVSAHRYASMDAAFQKVQGVMAEQNGPVSTRYCGGCHDPISLFSGTKNIFAENLTDLSGYQEGISCIACHSIVETDVKGNADYTLRPPQRYAWELAVQENPDALVPRLLRDFLIRAYPAQHVQSLSHQLFKSPEFCAACHKQFIDAEINKVGWVQLQNQYDNWRKSRWNHPGDAQQTIECRECHMPLVAQSTEPASGDEADYNRTTEDGSHRNHRFLGANQFIPTLMDLPGAEEHVRLTESWLRGEVDIPEIAHKWTEGPAVPIELVLPESATADEPVRIGVRMTNNKAGHDFPTGPLDIIQAWVELIVTADDGSIVYQSGVLDEAHFIEAGSFIFKAEAVDQYGNLIDRHNLWEMVGVRFKRSLFPGFADQATYTFSCAGSAVAEAAPPELEETHAVELPLNQTGTLHVNARLRYRKIDQFMLNFLLGEGNTITAPVTTLSEAQGTIRLIEGGVGLVPAADGQG